MEVRVSTLKTCNCDCPCCGEKIYPLANVNRHVCLNCCEAVLGFCGEAKRVDSRWYVSNDPPRIDLKPGVQP